MKFITDKEYERIKDILPGNEKWKGRRGKDNKLFLERVLYIAKTGCGWRQLPQEYGKWYSVWQRFRRWSHKGIWDKVFEELKPELNEEKGEVVAIDSTSIKVHQEGMRYLKKIRNWKIE